MSVRSRATAAVNGAGLRARRIATIAGFSLFAAGSATAAGNPLACETTDRSALAAIDQQIAQAGQAKVTPASVQAFNVLIAKRKTLLLTLTQDCAAACALDKVGVNGMNNQIQALENTRLQPQNTGPASIDFQLRVNQLRQTLQGDLVREHTDCGPATDGFITGTGRIRPDYLILTVVYAPPGSSSGVAGMGASSVDYSNQSATGSAVSVQQSWTNKLDIDGTFSGGAFGDDASLELDFSTSSDKTDKNEVDITKTTKGEIKISGPAVDGVDHDNDRIYLLLNPVVTLTQTKTSASWVLGVDGPQELINYVEVGWLKNPANMPPGVQSALRAAGITPDVYPTIMKVDPFATGSTPIDPARFVELSEGFPFEPVSTATATPGNTTGTFTNDTKYVSSIVNTATFGVAVTVTAKVDAVFASLALKVSDAFTYTHQKGVLNSNEIVQSAAFTIAQPAFGYTGGSYVFVYWDSVFQTFMFSIPPSPPTSEDVILTGTITDAGGQPARGRLVTLTVDGKSFRTVTNGAGVYKLYSYKKKGRLSEAGTLQISDQTEPVTVNPQGTVRNVLLAPSH